MNLIELLEIEAKRIETAKAKGKPLPREQRITLHRISQVTGISYSTLHAHRRGHPVTLETAKRIAAFDPRLSVADILGIKAA